MEKNFKRAGLIIFVLLFVGSSFLGWARYKTLLVKKELTPILMDSVRVTNVDTVKVDLLKKVYSKLNLNKNEFLIAGSINAKNGADTTDRLNNSSYVFSRKGTSFYFKLGNTETINAKGIYLYVDHEMKRILLAKEKRVISNSIVPELEGLLKRVNDEGFDLVSTTTGDIERISLKNPYHLSCKEYTVVFNKKTFKPNRIYVRLSDAQEPENSRKDNVVDFRIRLSSPVSEIEKYTVQNMLKKDKMRWSLSTAFKSYELINTL